MAAKKGKADLSAKFVNDKRSNKITSIGSSRNTHYKSKNDKRNKKVYRGQGH